MPKPHPDITTYPDFIIDAAGIGFVAGGMCGTPYHFIKGLYNSPNGRRLAAGAQAVRINAPRLASGGAAYLAVAETFRYAMISARKKDDIWSYVLPGFAAGACVPVGPGPRAVGISAIGGLCAATAVYVPSFCLRRRVRYPSRPPLEDPGVTPPSVVDSIPTELVRDVDLRCTQHI
ncbi:mitochondrial import inner membrane translocase subunit TIM17-3-like [Lolium perenne]|uniref:mitochondrial import inner membrane translocase subunit TIM17-3-like n=1 Tax=Lolium perenne TaxID=4522 RepID=UPI0021E9E892|nr:mitochondrial import inner membrane translocase subunit TIM17-3-like [Lolium perenne]